MSSSVTELTAILETVMEIHHCIGLYRYVLMECVYELFCYGADCNNGDSNGDTTLHLAVQVCIDGMCV